MSIADCIEKGHLVKIKPDEVLAKKELNEAAYDIEKAEKAIGEHDYKWSIIKSYYAMFHAARAVLFRLGYHEKRHYAIAVVLEELHKQGKVTLRTIDDFKSAVAAREDADYHYTYSQETAAYTLQIAAEFKSAMEQLAEKP